jgi:hypothetical protein
LGVEVWLRVQKLLAHLGEKEEKKKTIATKLFGLVNLFPTVKAQIEKRDAPKQFEQLIKPAPLLSL